MELIAYDPYAKPETIPDYVTLVDWETAFKTADFVSLHMPLTKDNRGFIGRKEFEMMKPDAYFVNCARGEVVNEPDLIQALNEKAGNSREEIRELMVDHSRQNQSELAETMDQNSEKIISAVTAGQKEAKQELFDRIHEESVKNYRNVQALMEEQAEQVGVSDISEDSIGKIRRSFRGVKIFSGISFLGVLAIIVFLILQYLRII